MAQGREVVGSEVGGGGEFGASPRERFGAQVVATSAGVYHFLANCNSIGFPFGNAAEPAAVRARPEGLSTERRSRWWLTWAGRGCMSRVPGGRYTIGCAVMRCTPDPQISG